MNPRVAWADLPAGLRGRLEAAAGTFVRAEQVSAGHNCLIGMILHTTSGQWFLKGVRVGRPRAAWTHGNEAAINPWVAPVTAPLEFRVRADGWDVLGFGYLAGHRHADLAPGSPDLPAIAAALQALAAIPAPRAVQLRAIEDRRGEYIGDRAALRTAPSVQVKVGTDYELAHALKIDPRAIRAAQDLACSASPVQISFGRDASNRPNTGAASGVTSAVSPVRLNIRWIVRSSGAHPDCARKIRWTSAAVRPG